MNSSKNPERSHLAWKGRQRGWPVDLETERFNLRSLSPPDASPKWVEWVNDAEAMKPLHMPARLVSVEEIAEHIKLFDNDNRLLVGIFARDSGEHIGFYKIEIDKVHGLASFDDFVGDRNWWGNGVVNETREAILDHFFDARGIEKIIGQPLERNFAAVFNYKQQGWRLEGIHKKQRRSVLTGARIDQYTFGLRKEEWHALRKEKSAR